MSIIAIFGNLAIFSEQGTVGFFFFNFFLSFKGIYECFERFEVSLIQSISSYCLEFNLTLMYFVIHYDLFVHS